MASASVQQQVIRDDSVHIRSSAGGGRSVHAARDFEAKSQIMFVAKPLLVALNTANLIANCYSCLKPPRELQPGSNGQDSTLKKCGGCKVVRFCNQKCQKLAWSQYHRLECKLYGNLFPRILPSNVRAMIRLLKQHKAGLLLAGEWDQLLSLESHVDQICSAGGERLEDLLLMTQAIKSYSGSDLDPQLILRVLCTLTINTFTLTNPQFEPIGLALHPRTSMFNHSCVPNAYVRFDVSRSDSLSRPADSHGISVHALQPLQKDEEITLSYVDGKYPFEQRQRELKERYFFICACELCRSEKNAPVLPSRTSQKAKSVESHAERVLSKVQSAPVVSLQHIDEIRTAMVAFAEPGCWPLYHYPWLQLRHELLQGLIGSTKYSDALLQSAAITRYIHPAVYEQPHHPIRLTQMWTLWNLCRTCVEAGFHPTDRAQDSRSLHMLNMLSCIVIDDLNKVLTDGIRINGEIEYGVDEALQLVAGRAGMWGEYQRAPTVARKNVWAWLENEINCQLKKEGVSQTLIDEVSLNQGPSS
ncbi:hypothetical protein PV08_06112 [Exophiala spinifera]|uniref:Uncharacterized protein n=1 Tax=Exophiala spinifera TaxID=91928 RepID=A0A0D1YM40_9EURO|nr:uncharacterized protein PV08_06112 [Exophiala spinifera]KIW16061.1 hypothetical protein PV08_06112 [Exophiala spinifera]